MTPDQLRELIEKATPKRLVEGPDYVALMNAGKVLGIAPLLLELWEAVERYREDVRNLDDWLRVGEVLTALEEA